MGAGEASPLRAATGGEASKRLESSSPPLARRHPSAAREGLTHFGHFSMTETIASLRSDDCPNRIGLPVRILSDYVSEFIGIRRCE